MAIDSMEGITDAGLYTLQQAREKMKQELTKPTTNKIVTWWRGNKRVYFN